jgi:choline dehydrogenase-like flavoprotein
VTKPLAVVVGSGASGGMVARLLAKSGQYRVLILEKGRNPFVGLGGPAGSVGNIWANDEIAHEARQGLEDQDVLLEPRSFRSQGFTAAPRQFVGDVNTLPTVVGGGTTHYDAKARRLREVDFIANSLLRGYPSPSADPSPDTSAVPGANYANWPMQYKHLEAFYAVSEEIVGVQGPASGPPGRVENTNPWESWRSTPFPVPPGTAQLNSLLTAYAGVALGYSRQPVPVPTSIVSRPYRDGRPACVDCGFCLDFGCPINAKGGGVWQVNEAIANGAELISQANVIGFEHGPSTTSSARRAVTAVTFLFTGTPADVVVARGNGAPVLRYGDLVAAPGTNEVALRPDHGDLLVLANTPVEATRLSIVSGTVNTDLSPSATEPSGQLGRNLMFHLQTTALAVLDRDVHSFRGRTSTHTLDAFAGAGPSAADFFARGGAGVPRAGIMEMGGNLNPIQAATEVAAFLYGERLKAYMALGPFTKHLVAFTLQGEDMPQLANAVDLDPDIVDVYGQPVPRITYSNHPYELAASAYYTPKMLELLEAVGLPPSPYPDIHPVFAAAINTTLPALPVGAAENLLYQVTSPTIGAQTLAANATPFNDIPASRHIMGTHRMAFDPEHGPCDPFGRYWSFDNLYHAGGGLYVTAAGFNVTLTMWALSYWQAAAVVSGIGNPASASYPKWSGDWATDEPLMDEVAASLRQVLAAYDPDTTIAKFIKGKVGTAGGYDAYLRTVS